MHQCEQFKYSKISIIINNKYILVLIQCILLRIIYLTKSAWLNIKYPRIELIVVAIFDIFFHQKILGMSMWQKQTKKNYVLFSNKANKSFMQLRIISLGTKKRPLLLTYHWVKLLSPQCPIPITVSQCNKSRLRGHP